MCFLLTLGHPLYEDVSLELADDALSDERGRLDPQLGLGRFALAHPSLVAFDHRQELAANLINFERDEWPTHYEAVSAAGDRVQIANRHTRVRPCWMHVPGLYGRKRAKQVGVYQKLSSTLVPQYSK